MKDFSFTIKPSDPPPNVMTKKLDFSFLPEFLAKLDNSQVLWPADLTIAIPKGGEHLAALDDRSNPPLWTYIAICLKRTDPRIVVYDEKDVEKARAMKDDQHNDVSRRLLQVELWDAEFVVHTYIVILAMLGSIYRMGSMPTPTTPLPKGLRSQRSLLVAVNGLLKKDLKELTTHAEIYQIFTGGYACACDKWFNYFEFAKAIKDVDHALFKHVKRFKPGCRVTSFIFAFKGKSEGARAALRESIDDTQIDGTTAFADEISAMLEIVIKTADELPEDFLPHSFLFHPRCEEGLHAKLNPGTPSGFMAAMWLIVPLRSDTTIFPPDFSPSANVSVAQCLLAVKNYCDTINAVWANPRLSKYRF